MGKSIIEAGLKDDQPGFTYIDGDQNTYQGIDEVEARILETFEEYEETGLPLDIDNMADIAVDWRDNAKQMLEENGEITDAELAEAYKDALGAVYDL